MRRVRLNPPLLINLGAATLAVLVLAVSVPPLAAAIFAPGLNEDPTAQRLARLLLDHELDRATYEGRFTGRSLFYKPKPPPVTRVVEQPDPEPEPEAAEPAPPPVPISYNGPSILFVLGDEVWFHNGMKLKVGEEDGGVKVIASDPPWSVRLGYRGGEYDVQIFKRRFPGLEGSPQARRPTPGLVLVEKSGDDNPEGGSP